MSRIAINIFGLRDTRRPDRLPFRMRIEAARLGE
jgi:hypothetical protein